MLRNSLNALQVRFIATKNEKAAHWTAFVFGCGGGTCLPTRVACRFHRQTQFASKASRFGSTASQKATLWLSCGANPLPPVASRREILLKLKSHSVSKKQRTPDGVLCFLVAGVGLEPHDLRVMSPTSYQLLYPAIYEIVVPVTGIEPVRCSRITGF